MESDAAFQWCSWPVLLHNFTCGSCCDLFCSCVLLRLQLGAAVLTHLTRARRWGKKPGESPGNPFAKPTWQAHAASAFAQALCGRVACFASCCIACPQDTGMFSGRHGQDCQGLAVQASFLCLCSECQRARCRTIASELHTARGRARAKFIAACGASARLLVRLPTFSRACLVVQILLRISLMLQPDQEGVGARCFVGQLGVLLIVAVHHACAAGQHSTLVSSAGKKCALPVGLDRATLDCGLTFSGHGM